MKTRFIKYTASLALLVSLFIPSLASAQNTFSIQLQSASSQFLSRSSAAAVRLKNDFTIEFWVQFVTLPSSGNNMWLVDKKSEAAEDFSVYAVYLNNTSGTYQLRLRTTGGSSGSLVDRSVTWTPTTSVWHHVAITREDTSGNINFYVDGVQQGTTQVGRTGTLHDNADLGFYVGRYKSADLRLFNGFIDELRIWSVERTQSEISLNMGEGISSATNLAGSWRFNNDFTDGTGNGNTLTNNNGSTFTTAVARLTNIRVTSGSHNH